MPDSINHIGLITQLMQQMCVLLAIAYLLSKTPLFAPLMQVTMRLPGRLVCYCVFSAFCILGSYLGFFIEDAIANTRAIGAVLGGIFGGPVVGFAVGLTGGLHRYFLGGFSATACAISTTLEGLLGGLVHFYLLRTHRADRLLHPLLALATTMFAELMQMLIIVLITAPFDSALRLVKHIVLPMLICNSMGAALFMCLIQDRRELLEKYSLAFSAKALRIAERAIGILSQGFDPKHCMRVAEIMREETGVGAVAITDREKLLAFVGIGADHHAQGMPIFSPHTLQAIAHNEVIGANLSYQCLITKECKLGSALVIPLRDEANQVFGTIELYEPKSRLFSSLNRTLGEGIARLLSNQVLASKLEEQKRLLAQSEVKLLEAQINPHFLFNALNTLNAIIRRNPDEARTMVHYLSTFFRKNLKRTTNEVSLSDEIEHIDAYLRIEEARFAGRLRVNIAIPEALLSTRLPAFSLQPLVENAIKHGVAQKLKSGQITIRAEQEGADVLISVEDDAGLYEAPPANSDGLGMSLVNRRISMRYGKSYGLQVDCAPHCHTRITLRIPFTTGEETVC